MEGRVKDNVQGRTANAFDQLASVSTGRVLNAGIADVGKHRERLRRRRLWRLAFVVVCGTLMVMVAVAFTVDQAARLERALAMRRVRASRMI